MRAKILLFLLGLNFAFAFDIYELSRQIKPEAIGEFNQTKLIGGFEKPIMSSGEFRLGGGEFELRTLRPVQNAVKVSEQGIFTLKDGEWQKNDEMQGTELFLSLMRLDVAALEREFTPNLSGDAHSWRLLLTPKSYVISKIFKSIEIAGGSYVKSIRLIELNGDETINEFSLK